MAASTKTKQASLQWLQDARRSGMLLPKPCYSRRQRSQVELGVSIEYLAKLADSIRDNPLLPTTTEQIVHNLIAVATEEHGHGCRFVDLIPEQYLGYASAVVVHAWGSDFLDMVMALVDDFNMRFDAHKAYRQQRKSTAMLLAEENALFAAAEEAKATAAALQAQAEAAIQAAQSRNPWSVQVSEVFTTRKALPKRSSNGVGFQLKGQSSLIAEMNQLQEHGSMRRNLSVSPSHVSRSYDASTQNTSRSQRTGTAGSLDTMCHLPGLLPPGPRLSSPGERRQLARNDISSPGIRRSMTGRAMTFKERIMAVRRRAENPMGGFAMEQLANDESGMQEQGARTGLTPHVGGLGRSRRNTVLGSPDQRASIQGQFDAPISPTRALGAPLVSFNRRPATNGGHNPPVSPPKRSVLARCGTLYPARFSLSPLQIPSADVSPTHTAKASPVLMPPQSIYERAAVSTDLTQLLQPHDEEQELVDNVLKAHQEANEKLAAAQAASQDKDWLLQEKRQLLGHYVWIDILALEQGTSAQQACQPDLAAAARLIHVVRRTVLIVDEEWRVLKRLWCLFEIWCSMKYRATICTLSTPAALLSPTKAQQQLAALQMLHSHGYPSPKQPQQQPGTPGYSETASQLNTQSLVTSRASSRPQSAFDLPQGHLDLLTLLIDETPIGLQPIPAHLDILQGVTSRKEDRQAIVDMWQQDLPGQRLNDHCWQAAAAQIRERLVTSRAREAESADLTRHVYESLTACSRNWRAVQPGTNWKELELARNSLMVLVKGHMAEQLAVAKDIAAVSDADVELELWQLLRFVSEQLSIAHEEPFWITEFKRYATLANRSYATRFSATYVDKLLRAAGTFDDIRTLRAYVYRQAHPHKVAKQEEDVSD